MPSVAFGTALFAVANVTVSASLEAAGGPLVPLAIDVITGTSNHAQSPVSLATNRKYTTRTTSTHLRKQPTKRLRNDQASKQPQNHSNDPNRSITINPTHTNTSFRTTPKPPPQQNHTPQTNTNTTNTEVTTPIRYRVSCCGGGGAYRGGVSGFDRPFVVDCVFWVGWAVGA